jgi:hypothetical protein
MKVLKRASFTLLEVLISLTLTTIILGVLLSAYFQAESLSRDGERLQREIQPKRALSARLDEIFIDLEPPKQNEQFFFTPVEGELLFSYHNGANLDPSFSGEVLGRLFVDDKGHLVMLTWPPRKLWPEGGFPPFRREVLLEEIETIAFRFFATAQGTTAARWVDIWPKEAQDLPGIIELTITPRNATPEIFLFFVPQKIGVVQL